MQIYKAHKSKQSLGEYSVRILLFTVYC